MRTAAESRYSYMGHTDARIKRPNLEQDFPGIRWIVPPADAATLEKALKGLPSASTEAERISYAREAAALLAKIAADRKSPLGAELNTIEPALSLALSHPSTSRSAAAALSEVPDPDAQRSLLDLVLDPSRPADLRSETAAQLVAASRRFRPLLTAHQEARLVSVINEEIDPGVRAGLTAILAALKPAVPSSSVKVRPLPRTRIHRRLVSSHWSLTCCAGTLVVVVVNAFNPNFQADRVSDGATESL